jgi:hypothetical protein
VAVNEGQVVVEPSVDGPQLGPGPRRGLDLGVGVHGLIGNDRTVALVKAVEQGDQVGDGLDKVHADRAKEIGGTAVGPELGRELPDMAGDVALGAVGDDHGKEVDAIEAAMGQVVTLAVVEGVPVTQHLGLTGVAPDKIEAALLVQQSLGAGPRAREAAAGLIVAAGKVHAVDAGDGGPVKVGCPEESGQGRGAAEAVGKVGQIVIVNGLLLPLFLSEIWLQLARMLITTVC